MKKLLLIMFAFAMFAACTPETTNSEEVQTDPQENCPPNDANCNGIPDDKE